MVVPRAGIPGRRAPVVNDYPRLAACRKPDTKPPPRAGFAGDSRDRPLAARLHGLSLIAATSGRAKPVVSPEYCKGCGRCIDSCAYHCIEAGQRVHEATGAVPVTLHLEHCTACGLCLDACPEPYGLRPDVP